MNVKKSLLYLFICSGVLLVTGCGGGGSSDKETSSEKPITPKVPEKPTESNNKTSPFVNSKVDLKIQYQNSGDSSKTFNANINFQIDGKGDITGEWNMPTVNSQIRVESYRMTLEQYRGCYNNARRMGKMDSVEYINYANDCLEKSQDISSSSLIFILDSSHVEKCIFIGQLLKKSDGLVIMNHINKAQGEKIGGTHCYLSFSEKSPVMPYYHFGDILYWVNGVGSNIAGVSNIDIMEIPKIEPTPNPPVIPPKPNPPVTTPNNKKTASVNQCITIDRKSNSLSDFLVNKCGRKIYVEWIDQGYCKSRCGSTVTTRSSITKTKGTVRYAACPEPYAAYKPNAPKPAGYKWQGGSFECVQW